VLLTCDWTATSAKRFGRYLRASEMYMAAEYARRARRSARRALLDRFTAP
jgi:hypothetical protein